MKKDLNGLGFGVRAKSPASGSRSDVLSSKRRLGVERRSTAGALEAIRWMDWPLNGRVQRSPSFSGMFSGRSDSLDDLEKQLSQESKA